MSNDEEDARPAAPNKRKHKGTDGKQENKRKRRKERKENGGKEVTGTVMNVDQLTWTKISLENDEFDDFEEIEGVDVEYVDKDGSKVIQFKVPLSSIRLTSRLSIQRKGRKSQRRRN